MNLPRSTLRPHARVTLLLTLTLSALLSITGCVVVGGSSHGGWFIWPGGFGLVFLVLLYIFFFRGRR